MEQKTVIFTEDIRNHHTINKQLKDFIDCECIDGWYSHQIIPTRNGSINSLFTSALIILHRKKIKQTNFIG